MRLSTKQKRFAELLGVFLVWIHSNPNRTITFGEVWRTKEQQELYVKAGKSKTMNSKHLDRCAVDINLFIDGRLTWVAEDFKPLGEFWESLDPGCKWGGNFKNFVDAVHFEYS